jgi:hypothetical protein
MFFYMLRFLETHNEQLYNSILEFIGHGFKNEFSFMFWRLHESEIDNNLFCLFSLMYSTSFIITKF